MRGRLVVELVIVVRGLHLDNGERGNRKRLGLCAETLANRTRNQNAWTERESKLFEIGLVQ